MYASRYKHAAIVCQLLATPDVNVNATNKVNCTEATDPPFATTATVGINIIAACQVISLRPSIHAWNVP
jgi:hypothetical protein